MKGFIMPGSEVLITFTDWLLKVTVDISFCVLLILIVRRFFARFFGARLSRILWIVLFIRCIVPWSFSINIFSQSILHEFSTALNPKPSASSQVEIQPSDDVTISSENISSIESTSNVSAASPRKNIFTIETLRAACVMLWISGLITLLSVTIFRSIKISQRATKTPKPIPSWLQEIFLECRKRLKLKTWPVLIVSSSIDTPCLLGTVRPRILLPYNLVSRSNREQLTHIIMHELAHIKQGDIWLSWFWTIVCSLQWFNPLIWISGRYMYLDREMACDECVLKMLESQSRIEYSHSLLDLFKKVNLPARCPGLACVVERKTNIERRLGMITKYKIRSNRQILLGSFALLLIAALSLTSFAGANQAEKLTSEKAELMGRVEDFFMHNFRDVTARKSLQWEQLKKDEKGNSVIRYMYEAQIWEKEWKIMNQVFTFDKDGTFVNYKDVEGFPKDKEVVKFDTSTEEGMKALVERFFSRNYRDITARKTIEWGKAATDEKGNRSIRYKYEATIWDKDKIISDKIFTFTPEGEYVSVVDVEETRWDEGKAIAGSIATALRAYVVEHLSDNDFNNITLEQLGLTKNDLQGQYFKSDNFIITNVSLDGSRENHSLHYTITVTRPDDSWKIKAYQLVHTGQWIPID